MKSVFRPEGQRLYRAASTSSQGKREAFYEQHGFWPWEEACATCGLSRSRHDDPKQFPFKCAFGKSGEAAVELD